MRGPKSFDISKDMVYEAYRRINYYGRYYPSALVPSLNRINDYLVRWIVQKYKRYRRRWMRARDALAIAAALYPGLFAHWKPVKP
ncbi:MAG: group II intron maturase-specific domain-containing protein [Carbonactinosporaceae bacterium]